MNTKRILVLSGATAITFLIALPAFAATATNTRHGILGTVSSIQGSILTVKARNGTIYNVNAENATVQKGMGKNKTLLALSTVAVNDKIAVKGAVSGTNVTATTVYEGAARHLMAHAALGTIQSVNGSTFTLSHKTKTGSKTVTVTTTSNTRYKENGVVGIASELVPGQKAVVMGTKDSVGNVTDATSVNVFVRAKN